MTGEARFWRPAALVRLLQVIALLGFLLPWFVISCAGKTFIEPRGYELALGLKIAAGEDFSTTVEAPATPRPAALVQTASAAPTPGPMASPPSIPTPPAPKRAAREAPAIVQWLAGGALALLLLGFCAGLAVRGRAFLSLAAGAGFAAAGLAWASVAGVDMELQRNLIALAKDNPMGAMAVAQLDVKMRLSPGLWMTVLAALSAGLVAVYGLWRLRRTPAPTPAGPAPIVSPD